MKIFTKDDDIYIKMNNNSWQEICINEELDLHIIYKDEEGYTIDFYKHRKSDDIDDNFDDDYIRTEFISWSDLKETEDRYEDAMRISPDDYDMYI